ncbi:MAG: hypothetical protein ACKOOG_04795, partial [Actinomycetota bacterium]
LEAWAGLDRDAVCWVIGTGPQGDELRARGVPGVEWLGPGTIGSWRCTTSGSIERKASAVRRAVAGVVAIGATEPFDYHSSVGPTLSRAGSGGGPSHGAMIRASTPRPRSSRASPST